MTVTFSTGNNFCSQATLDIYGTFSVADRAFWYNYGTTNNHGTLDIASNGFAQYGSFYEFCGAVINGNLYGGAPTVSCSSPTISTALSATAIPPGEPVHDAATLSNFGEGGGTVQYEYFNSGTCSGAPVDVGSPVVVSAGSVPNSQTMTFATAGSYGWKAVYSGDTFDAAATSACEPLTVAAPSLSLSVSSGPSGTTTVLTGSGYDPSVLYAACPAYPSFPLGCYGPGVAFTPDSSGAIHISLTIIVNSPGSYVVAVSAGSIPNVVLVSQAPFTVSLQPAISTSLSAALVDPIYTVYDTATLSGASSTAGGTVTYSTYSGSSCSGGALFSSTVTVTNGVVPNSAPFTVPSVGAYSWQAVYSGDAIDFPATSGCELMTGTVPTGATVTPSVTSVDVGQTISFAVSWAGGVPPFEAAVYPSPTNTCNPNQAANFRQTGLSGPPATVIATASSTAYYCAAVFDVSFAYASYSSLVLVTVSPDPTVSVTTPGPFAYNSGATASALHASVTYGGPNTASVEWRDSTTSSCGASSHYTGVSGMSFVPSTTSVGVTYYCAVVSDSGVPGYSSASAAVEVTVSSPTTLVTNPSPTSVTLSSASVTLKDSATLAGGSAATGTITFSLHAPGGQLVDTETVSVIGNGVYETPVGYALPSTGTVTGTYQWDATYSGDLGNSPASDNNAPNEKVLVSPAAPSVTTSASPSSITIGSSPPAKDTATLSAGYYPTGTLTFVLYPDASCSLAAVDTETVPVSGNGIYTTPVGFAPVSAGTYQWIVSYNGDGNNSPVAALCGTSGETVTVIQKASPTIVTSPSPTEESLGPSTPALKDSATLSGGNSETGTITFVLRDPGGSAVDTETVPVNGNGVYTSPVGFVPNAPGTYQWAVSYAGDANNNGASSAADSESVTVAPATPSVSTAASPTSITLSPHGTVAEDTATISGGYSPKGTLTFVFYPDVSCSAPPVDTETVPVNGNGGYSTPVGFVPTVPGTYQWVASYSGDANDLPTTTSCGGAGETVTVQKASPAIVTTPSPNAWTLAATPTVLKDSATLSGGSSEGGTVTFTLQAPDGPVVDTETVPANGDGVYTTPAGFVPTSPGTYQWSASYSGDANNNAASESNAADEHVVVSAASPSLVTTPSPASVTLGTTAPTLKDSAVLAGGYHETGTITFTLHSPGGPVVDTETVPVAGDGAYNTPAGFTLATTGTVTGTYQWTVAYSGDGNNNGATGGLPENVVASLATPVVTTSVSPSSITLGASPPATATDAAILSGAYYPTGTITFFVYGDSSCVTAPLSTSTVTVSPSGSSFTSGAFTPTGAGILYWTAAYSGDTNNHGFTTTCGASGETVTVNRASSSVSTAIVNDGTNAPPSGSEVTSASFHDTSTVTGSAANPTGMVVYSLFGNDGCSGAASQTYTVKLGGGLAPASPSSGPLPAGSYGFQADYSGDSNYQSSTSLCEPFSVAKATTSTLTTVHDASTNAQWSGAEVTGASAYDAASVTGVQGFTPTGTATYTYFTNGGCSGSGSAEAVTLGLGVVPSSPPTGGLAAGGYSFLASYSGDSNYIGSTGTCESFTVQKAASAVATVVHDSTSNAVWTGSEVAGSIAYDSSAVSGVTGFTTSGSVTYSFFTNKACTGSPFTTQTASLSASGAPPNSSPTAALGAGSYSYSALYGGDSNYKPSNAPCEQFAVLKSPSTTSVSCSPNPVTIGSPSVCKVMVTGYLPGGTVTLSSSSAAGTFKPSNGCTLSGGACSVTYTDTSAGKPSIGTSYGGDANNLASATSSALTENYKDCGTLVPNKGGANLKGADLDYCNLAGYDMSGDNLMGATMRYANLQNTNLNGANLKGGDLSGVTGQNANFRGSNLLRAILTNANLSHGDFQGANLMGDDLSHGIFDHANFQGANLMNSDMSFGDFDYSDFTGANTHGVNINGATFVGAVNPP